MIMLARDAFRTQSNIYDVDFCENSYWQNSKYVSDELVDKVFSANLLLHRNENFYTYCNAYSSLHRVKES